MKLKRYTAGVDVYGQPPVFYLDGTDACVFPAGTLFLVASELAAEADGNEISWKAAGSDYEKTLAENRELREKVAFLESREVCAAAHENVETCGYCQRDALQRDIETGFMQGAYARLKNLQDTEAKLEAYRMAESLAVSHIMTLNRELNHWADYCDCDCDACRDLANTIPGSQMQRDS